MARAGIDAQTGSYLTGWDHCLQSILKILTTELGERVQLRTFGSLMPRLIDRPQNVESIIDVYMATAQALEPRIIEGKQHGEPGFVLLRTALDASQTGKLLLLVSGVFFERGHLGDYSNPIHQEATFMLTEVLEGVSVKAI